MPTAAKHKNESAQESETKKQRTSSRIKERRASEEQDIKTKGKQGKGKAEETKDQEETGNVGGEEEATVAGAAEITDQAEKEEQALEYGDEKMDKEVAEELEDLQAPAGEGGAVEEEEEIEAEQEEAELEKGTKEMDKEAATEAKELAKEGPGVTTRAASAAANLPKLKVELLVESGAQRQLQDSGKGKTPITNTHDQDRLRNLKVSLLLEPFPLRPVKPTSIIEPPDS